MRPQLSPFTLSLNTNSPVRRCGRDHITSVHFCVCLLPPWSLVKQEAGCYPNSASPDVRPQLQRQRDYGSELIPLLILSNCLYLLSPNVLIQCQFHLINRGQVDHSVFRRFTPFLRLASLRRTCGHVGSRHLTSAPLCGLAIVTTHH